MKVVRLMRIDKIALDAKEKNDEIVHTAKLTLSFNLATDEALDAVPLLSKMQKMMVNASFENPQMEIPLEEAQSLTVHTGSKEG